MQGMEYLYLSIDERTSTRTDGSDVVTYSGRLRRGAASDDLDVTRPVTTLHMLAVEGWSLFAKDHHQLFARPNSEAICNHDCYLFKRPKAYRGRPRRTSSEEPAGD